MKRLGILGGTFDPPHLAHLIAGERAVEEYRLDKLLFIPANVPPHKVGNALSAAADRLAMTRIAIADNPRFEVSAIEMEREGTSYTIDTIRELKRLHRPEELFLIIGSDMLAIFKTWYKHEEILKEAEVLVMPRPQCPPTSNTGGEATGGHVGQMIDMPLLDISSTDIRARVRAGKSIKYLVPDTVGAYIASHGLYL